LKEAAMSKFREKAEAQTEEIIGQMLGDELLVREGQERSRKVEMESARPDDQRMAVARDRTRSGKTRSGKTRSGKTPNQHQGAGNQIGKRDLQRGMPGPRRGAEGQGIVRDERGQEQPKDKARAQQVSRVDKGGDPPGKRK
jgi:hypothetical protein